MAKQYITVVVAALAVFLVAQKCPRRDGSAAPVADGSGSEGKIEGGKEGVSALRPQGRQGGGRKLLVSDDLAVAKSWGALSAKSPIKLPRSGTAKVALEATSAPVGGGVFVFCLVQGLDENLTADGSGGTLGPLECHVAQPGESILEARELIQIMIEPPVKGDLLYAKSLPITMPGEHHVQITHRGGETVVAEFVLNGVDSKYHAWSPFRPADKIQLQGQTGNERIVGVDGNGPALPKFTGYQAIDWAADTDPPRLDDSPLPALMPEVPDPGLRIWAKDDGFVIGSTTSINLSSPERNLLARWWVNGKPFVPRQMEQHRASDSYRESSREMQVHLEFEPEVLGARTGDRIGLQLLYVPRGWEFTAEDVALQQEELYEVDVPPVTRLSNRIEFVAW